MPQWWIQTIARIALATVKISRFVFRSVSKNRPLSSFPSLIMNLTIAFLNGMAALHWQARLYCSLCLECQVTSQRLQIPMANAKVGQMVLRRNRRVHRRIRIRFVTIGYSWVKVPKYLQGYAQEKAYCFLALCESCVKDDLNRLYSTLRSRKFNDNNNISLFARKVKE